MVQTGLAALYALHRIDAAMLDLRQKAAALDVGQQEAAQIKAIEAESAAVLKAARTLAGEQKDSELEQKGIEEKIAKFDKELYSGKVVSPREVENINKEIAMLRQQLGKIDERLLQLWEELPPAQAAAKEAEAKIAALQAEIKAKQGAALADRNRLQEAYTAKARERQAAVKHVPEQLLKLYEAIREKAGGTGLAVITEAFRCGGCGMHVPEKTAQAVKADKVERCESCRRILFSPVPGGD